uniref:sensor domain-containing diguanylate cyclase n=1 Tax=Ningiella ruwaisensis TaxID=2364274 RepID=UPI0010A07BDA|nr:diguanylate cyclase [Ningiella ruwaisensis]
MQGNQVIPTDRSYWIVALVSLFVFALLALTVSLTSTIEEKSISLESSFVVSEELEPLSIINIHESRFSPLVKDNLGLSDAPHWVRISPGQVAEKEQYIFELNYGLLDQLDIWVYALDENGRIIEEIATYTAGDKKAFVYRPIQHEQFLFPIITTTNQLLILLRVESEGPIKVPARLWEKGDFIEYSGSHKLFMGLFFGYMIAMALSNLFIYATTRNLTFAVYTGYVTSLAMVTATLHGIGFRYLWSNNIWFQERAITLFACFTLILIIIFSAQVLDLKNTSKRANKILNAVKYIFIILAILSFFLPYSILLKSILIMIAVTTPVILIASLNLAFKGNLIARYFSGAWAALLISGIALTLENLGLYELPIDASYLLMVGAIAETLLLALALAISFSSQYKQAETARALAVENERKAMAAKDELLQLQMQTKEALEYSVEERTLELEIALRELSEANRELERLSAIDPLTGLMNRRYFDKRLLAESRRSRREKRPLALAMLDIDHFKKINDNFGHIAGDACLKHFASILQNHIKRPSDVICRYGGEEFVAILPATDLEGAQTLMEKVRKALEQSPAEFENQSIKMTVSIGLSAKEIAGDKEQEALLDKADRLLYEAKESGRNKVIAQAL